MPKPELPEARTAEWMHPYRLSGVCPPRAVGLMLATAIGGGAVMGFVGYWGGWLAYWVSAWVGSFGFSVVDWLMGEGYVGAGAGLGLAFCVVLVILCIAFFYPFWLGASIGSAIAGVAHKARCRNMGAGVSLGVLGGGAAWGALALTGHLLGGGVRESSRILSVGGLEDLGIVAVLVLVVDAAIIVVFSAAASAGNLGDIPFCEACGRWYAIDTKASVPIATSGQLVGALASGSAAGLAPSWSGDQATIELRVQSCECTSADAVLTADVKWTEPAKKASAKPVQKRKNWFKTALSNSLGVAIQQALFIESPGGKPPHGIAGE